MKLANDAVWFGVLTIIIFHVIYLEAAVLKWLGNARRWEEDLQIVLGWGMCVVDKAMSAIVRESNFL